MDPKQISGNWAHGWALDQHTVRSIQSSENLSGRPTFETERTELGEALYLLKYRNDRKQVDPIARTIAEFVRGRFELSDIRAVLAVPPSDTRRSFQPVEAIAARIGVELILPAPTDYIIKTKQTAPLKSLTDKRQRREELDGAFAVADQRFENMHVLLIDDLFRSGETLKAVTVALLFLGKAGKVSAVTVTITRSNR